MGDDNNEKNIGRRWYDWTYVHFQESTSIGIENDSYYPARILKKHEPTEERPGKHKRDDIERLDCGMIPQHKHGS
jgi:hypothetical protein